jgi:hypothetical protein
MLTEVEARRAGEELLRRLNGSGWELCVHENCGWHYYCHNGLLSVYENGVGKYFTLLSADPNLKACGEIYWTEEERFDDPNKAVEHQMMLARNFLNKIRRVVDGVEKRLL